MTIQEWQKRGNRTFPVTVKLLTNNLNFARDENKNIDGYGVLQNTDRLVTWLFSRMLRRFGKEYKAIKNTSSYRAWHELVTLEEALKLDRLGVVLLNLKMRNKDLSWDKVFDMTGPLIYAVLGDVHDFLG